MLHEYVRRLYQNAAEADWQTFAQAFVDSSGARSVSVKWAPGKGERSRSWVAGSSADGGGEQQLNSALKISSADQSLTLEFNPGDIAPSKSTEIIEALSPHISIAADLARASDARARSAVLQAMLGHGSFGRCIVDSSGNVLQFTSSMRKALPAGTAISIEQRLTFQDPATESELGVILQRLKNPGEPLLGFIARRDEHDTICDLLIVTRAPALLRPDGTPWFDVIAIVTHVPLFGIPNVSHDLLSEALGLSPAETSLANALAAGATVTSYASETERKIATVRWHLHNAMQRVGTDSQVELVRLILAIQMIAH